MTTAEESASNWRKKRGTVLGSITKLSHNLDMLERSGDPDMADHATLLTKNLEELDAELKSLHFKVLDYVDDKDERSLEKEQDYLDKHSDNVTALKLRLKKLTPVVAKTKDPTSTTTYKTLSRKLLRLERKLRTVSEELDAMHDAPDVSLVELYSEQLHDDQKTLSVIYDEILDLDLKDDDDLLNHHPEIERIHFDCLRKVKKLRGPTSSVATADAVADAKGSKLPQLDVPTFDGDILSWTRFWEQFSISIHNRKSLSDAEKLVYLQQAIRKGSAKSTIEGLTQTGENYEEAVLCLKSRYDRPRLIYRTHVQKIMDAPPLKDSKDIRRLHDMIQQHLRALKSMDGDISGPFITSIIELKLDPDTLFEWQRHSQAKKKTPHYDDILGFLDLRAQASETSTPVLSKKTVRNEQPAGAKPYFRRSVASHSANADTRSRCILCDTEKHPLYACPRFKDMPHSQKLSTLKDNNLCNNCLGSGHFIRNCKSLHKCKRCQKPHHTLLHVESQPETEPHVSSNAAVRLKSSPLLMTCRVVVTAANGSAIEARALLDNASSASFITEHLAQNLRLPRSRQNVHVSGIAGVSPKSPAHSIASLHVSPTRSSEVKISLSAIVVPKVTCDLPLSPVNFDSSWKHLANLKLADPDYGRPGRIDLLLGVEVFMDVLRDGRRTGPPGSPAALETLFGWVLCGGSGPHDPVSLHVASLHTTIDSGDDLLRRFWEIEEVPASTLAVSPEEKFVVRHYEENYSRTSTGRFVVPLPKRSDADAIGESRSQAVRRFLSLERSLHAKDQFQAFDEVMRDYFDKEHAEPVPPSDLEKPPGEVFYLPMHAVRKESSTTTKIRAVFDAPAKSSTGVSLNDTLLVGPTVHPPLIDVLLRFRFHRIALTTDISKMFRAIQLADPDRDLHRFVWRSSPDENLTDYRMTRATFGVSASSFAANMSVRENAVQLALKFPSVLKVVKDSFYVDDGLTGADSIFDAINLQQQLQEAFDLGGFTLHKWNSSDPGVLQHIPTELRDSKTNQGISEFGSSTKALGLEWDVTQDCFHLTIAEWPPLDTVTKRSLVSDIAKIFDVMGWFAPTVISMKILLQRLWERKLDWDEPVPQDIHDSWFQWRSELPSLASKSIPRCYFPKSFQVSCTQLHGFCDASEDAYSGVIYLRFIDSQGHVHVSLVISKTRVAPIKRLSIPRLELCGAQLLADLLRHTKEVFKLSTSQLFAWTDSTIVLSWLDGSPRRFKTFVGNRVSAILDSVPPSCWNHIAGAENPADCASRGISPSELLEHHLWWTGPPWLHLAPDDWPISRAAPCETLPEEEKEVSLTVIAQPKEPILSLNQYSTFSRLCRVTAWVLRFTSNCRVGHSSPTIKGSLTVTEIHAAEQYWWKFSQSESFTAEIAALKADRCLPPGNNLLSLRPFLDSAGVLRVGGREGNAALAFARVHPVILHGKHSITKLLIRTEHLRLLHAGPTLLSASIGRRYHVIRLRTTVRRLTQQCITCRRLTVKPTPQMMGQLPLERVTPGCVFQRVGVDYAGPLLIKSGKVRKPTILKAYACIFVSLAVKAVHIELVSDLTTEAFMATLRRFIARRGLPSLIWSDHGTNFVGAKSELNELYRFLQQQMANGTLSDFCSFRGIEWRLIPEHGPHFGGLWEAAVKSAKKHLRRIVGDTKLTFEELTTVLAQIEACLNSRPLTPTSSSSDIDGMEA